MCDAKCLQFFMRWGHEHAHAIVTFVRLCKRAIKGPWDLPSIPAFDVLIKSDRNYTNIQEQSIFRLDSTMCHKSGRCTATIYAPPFFPFSSSA